jgi:hypothetical protein
MAAWCKRSKASPVMVIATITATIRETPRMQSS